jgi:hypothetical protein
MADHAARTAKRGTAVHPAATTAPLTGSPLNARAAVTQAKALGEQLNARSTAVAIQRKPARSNGLPDPLRTSMEAMSGIALDDVTVHRISDKPVQMQAHAYAQGTDIHLAPGQDNHLPHETWHVVQQKQGRVRATTQLKSGASLNDDAGLEREADRMGAAATTLQSRVKQSSLSKGAVDHSSDVVQAKLIQRGKPLSRPWFATTFDRISAVADTYLGAQKTYVLRDDIELTDDTIHVIDASKKYILGETHGSGSWEARSRNWTVDTMNEGFNALGNEQRSDTTANAPLGSNVLQPLEETLYVTLAAALTLQSLWRSAVPLSDTELKHVATHPTFLKYIKGTTDIIVARYGPKYSSYLSSNTLESLSTLKEQAFWTFADSLMNDWGSKLTHVSTMIHNAAANPLQKPAAAIAVIDNRGALDDLVDGVLTVSNLGEDAMVAGASSANIKSMSSAGGIAEAVRAASPLREQAMIRNIKAAAAPLLVQIGEEHLANVATGVGTSAVPVSKDTDFSAVITEKTA